MPELPVISVIVPSYNAERYLAPTLATIAKQNYPRLEVIVADGASTDRTAQIVEAFGPLVNSFISEPDKGQLDAVAKGTRRATGDICYWCNADDAVMPGAFQYVGEVFNRYPETDLIFSDSYAFSSEKRRLYVASTLRGMTFWDHFLHFRPMYSEGIFWKRSISEQAMPVDTSLRLCTDYSFFLQLGHNRRRRWVRKRLGAFREVPGDGQLSQKYKDRLQTEMDSIKQRMREKLNMSQEEFERLRKRHLVSFAIRMQAFPKFEAGLRFVGRKLTGDARRKRMLEWLLNDWLRPPQEVLGKLPSDLREV